MTTEERIRELGKRIEEAHQALYAYLNLCAKMIREKRWDEEAVQAVKAKIEVALRRVQEI